MDNLVFREAVRSDLPRLIELLADDFLGGSRENPGDPASDGRYQDAFDKLAGDDRNFLLVAELSTGVLVGYLQMTFIRHLSYQGAVRAQIEDVRVGSGFRGQGLGRALLTRAIETAKDRKAEIIQLLCHSSRLDALRFYAQLGFKSEHAGLRMATTVV